MDPRRQKVLDRLAKLLARTESDNVHEADVARKQADAYRAANNVSQEELDEYLDASAQAYESAGEISDDFWQVRLALAVADRVGCRAMKKDNRLVFEGSPKRTKRAATAYVQIAAAIVSGCASVYASWGHPAIFAPVLKPILQEEAARAVAERLVGKGQAPRFPVPPEPQQELLNWSNAMTGSTSCARIHMNEAKQDGRTVGLAVNLGDLG